MRVVTQGELGGPEVLEVGRGPVPELPTGILVRVHAAGVDPVDRTTRQGTGTARAPGEVFGKIVPDVVEP